MKTKFSLTFIIIALTVLTFANAIANTNEVLKLSFKSSGVVALTYTVAANGPSKVTIYNAEKEIVFSEKITNRYGVAKLYNISNLPEGEYFFEVADKNATTIKSIVYKKEFLNDAKNLSVEILPASNGKYSLTCKGAGKNAVNVSIYSKSQGLIFEDYIDNATAFSRTYDMSKLKSDNYVFEVTSAERVVSKEVSLVKTELSLSK